MTPRIERALGLERPLPLVRAVISAEIDRLIALMDGLDADPDFEPNGDELDASFPHMRLDDTWRANPYEDDEDTDDAEGDDPDREPSIGWTEEFNQANVHRGAHLGVIDGEEDGGDMPEGDDDREPNDTDLMGFGWPDDHPGVSQDAPEFHAPVRPLAGLGVWA